MKPLDEHELWEAPELAVLFPLLACIEGLVASLAAQHSTLHDEWRSGDPSSLCAARTLVRDLAKARATTDRYLRTIRALRPKHDEPLPF